MKRLVVAIPLVLILCAASQAADSQLAGSWTGTYTLNGPGQISVAVAGGRAVVALGVGHADVQTVSARITGERLRFQLPGRPAPLAFDARLVNGRLLGTVKQGPARGTFRARRGTAPGLIARGVYAAGGLVHAVVDDPYGPARFLDLQSGEVHGLYAAGPRFVIGSGFATREPVAGSVDFNSAGARLSGRAVPRRGRSGRLWRS